MLYELGCATLLTAPATTISHLRTALDRPASRAICGERPSPASQALVHNDQLDEAVRTVDAEAARLDAGPARMRLQAVQLMWEGIHAGEDHVPGRSRSLAELVKTCTGQRQLQRALLILRGFDAMTRGESAEEVVELCDRALVDGHLAGLGWTDTEWGIELLMMLGSSYAYADRSTGPRPSPRRCAPTRAPDGAAATSPWRTPSSVSPTAGGAGCGDAETTLRESLRIAERVGRGLPLYWSATCGLVDTLLRPRRRPGGLGDRQAVARTAVPVHHRAARHPFRTRTAAARRRPRQGRRQRTRGRQGRRGARPPQHGDGALGRSTSPARSPGTTGPRRRTGH